jgi:hypothetical protein
MKRFCLMLFSALLANGPVAYSQEIKFTYTEVKQSGVAQDVNAHGDVVLTNYPNPGGTILLRKNKMAPVKFQCWNTIYDATQPKKIDNQGNVVGNCQIDGTQHARQVGFVRDKKGQVTFLDVPGADITEGYTVSNDRSCGQYFRPFTNPNESGYARMHGFCKSVDGTYRTMDVPTPNTVTVITGINSRKRVGSYFSFDPATNDVSQWGAFLEDNGNFSPLKVPGAAWTYALDLNKFDDILLDSSLGNYILSDGVYYKPGNPPPDPGMTVISLDVNGMNDELELTGTYTQIKTGCVGTLISPCIATVKNFVATPGTERGWEK